MLKEEYIFLDVEARSKAEVLAYIVEKAKTYNLCDQEEGLLQDFKNRELEFSTGLQDGFAIPHARSHYVKDIAIFYLRLKTPVKWKTFDDQDVQYVFALLVPKDNKDNIHLSMISKLATCLLDDSFKQKIKQPSNIGELKTYITKKMKEEEE